MRVRGQVNAAVRGQPIASISAVIVRPQMAGNANGGVVSWVMADVADATMRECLVSWSRHPSLRKIRDLDHVRQALVHRSMNKTG